MDEMQNTDEGGEMNSNDEDLGQDDSIGDMLRAIFREDSTSETTTGQQVFCPNSRPN